MFMFFAVYDYKGGFDNFVGLTIVQPIWATIFSVVTIIICSIAGLPIRLNQQIKTWWQKNWFISLILIPIGLIMIFLSFTPAFLEQATTRLEGVDRIDTVPNQLLSIPGWFISSFATLHLFPPRNLLLRFESLISKLTK